MQNSKKKFIYGIISFLLVTSVLAGATFERMQSGFTVFGRNFFSGTGNETFDIDLFWTSNPDTEEWKNVETTGYDIPFGSSVLWEPDHSEIRYFKVENAGDYDFQYNLGIDVPDDELDVLTYIDEHPVGNVIDVALCRDINDLTVQETIGTLNECFQTPNILDKTSGDDLTLESGASTTYALIFTMKHSAGNDYQGTYDNNNNRLNNIGFKICTAAYAEEEEPQYDGEFGIALSNCEDYLYRVGTANTVPVSTFFYINESSGTTANSLFAISAFAADFDSDLLTFNFERVAGSSDVGCTLTRGTGTYSTANDFLDASKFQFTGTGVIKVKMLYNGVEKAALNLEILTGKNVYSGSPGFGNSNVILMDNITTTGQSGLSNGRILYGNGFTLTSSRSSTAGTEGYLTISNGTLDNVILNGEVYSTAVLEGTTNENYAPGVRIKGNAYIYNSYISECKYAVSIESGTVILKNTTVTGGALASIYISGGDVTLENCTTSSTERGGLKGLGVQVASSNCKVTVNGTLTQYNWLKKSDLPSNYSSYVSDVYNDTTYAYTNGGSTYVNMGIMFINMAGNLTQSDAESVLSDNTSNTYGYIEKTKMGVTGTLYTAKATMGSPDMLSYPGYSAPVNGQYLTQPTYTFDYTTKNYIERVSGDNNYCYYDSTTGMVNISFDKTDSSSAFSWDPMILTAQKYGSTITGYTVTMNGTDYTDSTISFTDTGNYEVIYTYNDVNQYYYTDATDLYHETVTYTQSVYINVTAVEPDVQIYNASFSYVSSWANSAKKVIINNNTYVMPDVSATSSVIGSTTIGGTTVYYPIVTVGPTGSNGNTAYSSGKGYYFAPVFNALNITDYNQNTGATQYTYNASSTTWPHAQAAASGPDSAYFGYAEGAAYINKPYGRSMNTQYYGYGSNNNGLCYTSNEIEKDNDASTHLVQYHYVSNDGTTYYYYIQYSFTAMTYSGSCLAEGTMITMADGSKKPIEDVVYGDKILSYNFFTGETEGKDIAILVNHGKENYKVFNLEFSDGTVLRLIDDHGVFDYTLNKYVYLNEENYRDYIGHKFVKLNEKGKLKKLKLTDFFITNELTTAYSITSAQNSNAFAQNMLTVAPPGEFYNWIDMGGKLRYDTKQFEADVAKYGLYDYSVFEDYVSYEVYEAFNGAYLKVPVEKGKFTFDDILKLIEMYGQYMK